MGKGKGNEDRGKQERNKVPGDGRTMNGFNGKTGERNRRFTCNSEYLYAPQRPQKGNRYGGASTRQRVAGQPSSKPYSSIAMESPVEVRSPRLAGSDAPERI